MSHEVQQKWCEGLKIAIPRFFKNRVVLEVGSLNVNGSIRPLFENCDYTGVDVIAGPDVDTIGTFHEIDFKGIQFDVVCSVNSLEHDMHWESTLPRMYELLKPGGLMFISASFTHKVHGTREHSPNDSGTTKLEGEWADYYKSISPEDILKHFKHGMFRWYMSSICHQDTQLVGIK